MLALGEDWTKNVELPAVKIQSGSFILFDICCRQFDKNQLAFLTQQDLPDAKSLSERASVLLSIEHKDITFVNQAPPSDGC